MNAFLRVVHSWARSYGIKSASIFAAISFVFCAALSALCAASVINAILMGMSPGITPPKQTLSAFGMVFFGLGAVVLPLVIIFGDKSES